MSASSAPGERCPELRKHECYPTSRLPLIPMVVLHCGARMVKLPKVTFAFND
jgi:hypothetical protein